MCEYPFINYQNIFNSSKYTCLDVSIINFIEIINSVILFQRTIQFESNSSEYDESISIVQILFGSFINTITVYVNNLSPLVLKHIFMLWTLLNKTCIDISYGITNKLNSYSHSIVIDLLTFFILFSHSILYILFNLNKETRLADLILNTGNLKNENYKSPHYVQLLYQIICYSKKHNLIEQLKCTILQLNSLLNTINTQIVIESQLSIYITITNYKYIINLFIQIIDHFLHIIEQKDIKLEESKAIEMCLYQNHSAFFSNVENLRLFSYIIYIHKSLQYVYNVDHTPKESNISVILPTYETYSIACLKIYHSSLSNSLFTQSNNELSIEYFMQLIINPCFQFQYKECMDQNINSHYMQNFIYRLLIKQSFTVDLQNIIHVQMNIE